MTKKKLKRIFFPLINSFLFIFFTSCGFGFDSPLSTFDAHGPVAQLQKDLFLFVFWLAVVVFILVEGAILYASYRYRQKDEKLPAQIHGNTKLELMWTILPSIIIVIIAVPTVMGIWKTQVMPDEENSLIVDSIGHQWWFEFRYPQEELVTANELHIPVNKDVIVNIESQDVIHSFWIPKIAGKIDMVPNHQNKLWIKADDPGIYYGQCAEFCGIAHALMKFRVVVHTEEDFENWKNDMRTPPAALNPGSEEDEGRKLFIGKCSMCHTNDSYKKAAYHKEIQNQNNRWEEWKKDKEYSAIVSAPNLTHFGNRLTIGAGLKENNLETLYSWIENPDNLKIGTRMKHHASIYNNEDQILTSNEIDQIAKYLLSLKPDKVNVTTYTNNN